MRDALLVLASINATLRTVGLPVIVPSTDEISTPPPRSPSTPVSGDEAES
jgi:hypothetical protein